MSGYSLIDSYLARLERALAVNRTVKTRILEEIRDHLLTAVEEEVRRGYSPVVAERRAIERFGTPDAIATQFASTRAKPTELSARRRGRRHVQKQNEIGRSSLLESNRNNDALTDCCSFCRDPGDTARQLVWGPEGVCICPDCLDLCTGILVSERAQRTHASVPEESRRAGVKPSPKALTCCCSFCGREHAEVERLIAGPKFVFICDCCVETYTAPVAGGTPIS